MLIPALPGMPNDPPPPPASPCENLHLSPRLHTPLLKSTQYSIPRDASKRSSPPLPLPPNAPGSPPGKPCGGGGNMSPGIIPIGGNGSPPIPDIESLGGGAIGGSIGGGAIGGSMGGGAIGG